MRMRYDAGKQKIRTHDARKRQRCSREDGIRIIELSEIAGDPGTEQKTEAKCDPNDSEGLGAVLRLRHVGNVSLRDGQVACGQAVDDAGKKHNPERLSETKYEEANACAYLTRQQDRPAADAVRQVTQRRTCDQLAQRVR